MLWAFLLPSTESVVHYITFSLLVLSDGWTTWRRLTPGTRKSSGNWHFTLHSASWQWGGVGGGGVGGLNRSFSNKPTILTSVVDLDSLIQHFKWIRLRVRIQGFVWLTKLKKIFNLNFLLFFFWSKIAIYFSLCLHKGRPSYRRSLQPLKKNIQRFERWNLITVFYFSVPFFPSKIRRQIQGPHWIRIHNNDFDSVHYLPSLPKIEGFSHILW